MGEGRRKQRRATALREAGMGHGREESSTKARGLVLKEGPGLVAVGGFRAALGNGTSAPHLCRQLLSYITKDKQTESLVEKLCQRFRTARYAAFLEGSLC